MSLLYAVVQVCDARGPGSNAGGYPGNFRHPFIKRRSFRRFVCLAASRSKWGGCTGLPFPGVTPRASCGLAVRYFSVRLGFAGNRGMRRSHRGISSQSVCSRFVRRQVSGSRGRSQR